MSSSRNPQIYVGGVGRRTRTEDLEKLFSKYGKIRDLSIKGKYAFIVRSPLITIILGVRRLPRSEGGRRQDGRKESRRRATHGGAHK